MFSLLGFAYYGRNVGRCLLLVLGMALAVTLYAGTWLGNASLEASFQDTLDRVAWRAEPQLSDVDGVAEKHLETVRRVECVQDAAAVMLRLQPLDLRGEAALAAIFLVHHGAAIGLAQLAVRFLHRGIMSDGADRSWAFQSVGRFLFSFF
jgi:hypothetical protein